MLAPLLCSLYYKDMAHGGIIRSIAITLGTALVLMLFSKGYENEAYINQKEGMTVVALGWTAICVFGALPFYFGPEFTNFTDAFFESVSGFTTTGSSVMTRIEGSTHGLL
ncbi:MAG: TrkH family potassium uptake protein, partial [Proteobacteria bacterium]|nr:TrkH family potassium uptake protein [Pseudomonadota bacterium]